MLVLKKIVHKPGQFLIHHSKCGEFIFLSMGQENDFPQCSCIFYHFKFVVIKILSVRYSASHCFTETHV